MACFKWRGHCNKERISRLRRTGGPQIPLSHGSMNDHIQVGLDDMYLTTVNRLYSDRINIDANHFNFTRRKNGCSRQTDIAETNNRNSFKHKYILDQLSAIGFVKIIK